MRKGRPIPRHVSILLLATLATGLGSVGCGPGRVPANLEIRAWKAGHGFANGPSESVWLRADGRGTWYRSEDNLPGARRDSGHFIVTPERMFGVWRAVRSNRFFRLAPSYARPMSDGGYLMLRVVAGRDTHQVYVSNTTVPRVRRIFAAINQVTPAGGALHYDEIGLSSRPSWQRFLRWLRTGCWC